MFLSLHMVQITDQTMHFRLLKFIKNDSFYFEQRTVTILIHQKTKKNYERGSFGKESALFTVENGSQKEIVIDVSHRKRSHQQCRNIFKTQAVGKYEYKMNGVYRLKSVPIVENSTKATTSAKRACINFYGTSKYLDAANYDG